MHTRHPAGIDPRRGEKLRIASALLVPALAVAVAATLFLSPPAEAQGRQFYGVNPQGSLVADDYNRMRNGRVGTVRFVLAWRLAEPDPGAYDLRRYDRVIGNLAARGIRALPIVEDPPGHVGNPPTRPADRRAFRGLMRAMAGRYGPGGSYWQVDYRAQHPGASPQPVRSWQIFNEQNGRFLWGGPAAPRAYGRLVRMGARGVRSRNPRAEIVLGGMFATPSGRGSMTSWRYLNRVYQVKRIKRAFDTVAVHPYSPNMRGIRFQMRRIRNVMRRNNDRAARIRVTEIGWGAQRGGHELNKTPKGQARMLRKSFRLFTRHRNRRKGWNVGGIIWWSWNDGAGCPFCASSGLFRGGPNERQPRPSWRAFRRMTR